MLILVLNSKLIQSSFYSMSLLRRLEEIANSGPAREGSWVSSHTGDTHTAFSSLPRAPSLLPRKSKTVTYPGLSGLSPYIQNTPVVKYRIRAPQYFSSAKH